MDHELQVVDQAKQAAIGAQTSAEKLLISLPLEVLKDEVTETAREYQQILHGLEQNLNEFEKLAETLRNLHSYLVELATNINDLPEKVSDVTAKAKLHNNLKVCIC